jgi:hypothetical protein
MDLSGPSIDVKLKERKKERSYFCPKTWGSQIPISVSTLHLLSLDKFG